MTSSNRGGEGWRERLESESAVGQYDFTVGKGLDTTTRASAHLLIGTDGTVYLSFDDYLGRNDLWAEYLDFLDSRWENRLEEEEQ